MLGRAAYHNPYLLAEVDRTLFADNRPMKSRDQVLEDFLPYIEQQLSQGVALNHITRHILGLFQSVPGAKLFRRHISEQAHKKGAGIEVIVQARQIMQDAQQRTEQFRNHHG